MDKFIILSLRAVGLLSLLLIFSLLSILIAPILPTKSWARVVYYSVKILLKCCSIQVKTVGKANTNYLLTNTMIVSNHLCWLDTLILYSVYFINFVGKVEMKKWPLFNYIIKSGGTIFINRKNKRDLLNINQTVSQELLAGRCIGLFAEGAVSNGQQLMPFKTSLLEAAILAKSTIIPVIIGYYHLNGTFAYTISYSGKNLCQNICDTATTQNLIAKVTILSAVDASNFTSRHQLAAHLYEVMSLAYAEREAPNQLQ